MHWGWWVALGVVGVAVVGGALVTVVEGFSLRASTIAGSTRALDAPT